MRSSNIEAAKGRTCWVKERVVITLSYKQRVLSPWYTPLTRPSPVVWGESPILILLPSILLTQTLSLNIKSCQRSLICALHHQRYQRGLLPRKSSSNGEEIWVKGQQKKMSVQMTPTRREKRIDVTLLGLFNLPLPLLWNRGSRT